MFFVRQTTAYALLLLATALLALHIAHFAASKTSSLPLMLAAFGVAVPAMAALAASTLKAWPAIAGFVAAGLVLAFSFLQANVDLWLIAMFLEPWPWPQESILWIVGFLGVPGAIVAGVAAFYAARRSGPGVQAR